MSIGPADHATPETAWSVVIPYYNEADFLPLTLASLARQSLKPFRLILVDNASTDDGPAFARAWGQAQSDIQVLHLHEPRPGQVHALKAGLAAVDTPFVAIADADTWYPPHYLSTAHAAFMGADANTVAFLAHDAPANPGNIGARVRRMLYTHLIPYVLSGQAHAGGYAHLFRTEALRAAGGYCAKRWPYVLKDHELIHRVLKQGAVRYAVDLWCTPSGRRVDRRGVRWSVNERIMYHVTPWRLKDWFFYGFLGPRLAARAQTDTVLRKRDWVVGG